MTSLLDGEGGIVGLEGTKANHLHIYEGLLGR